MAVKTTTHIANSDVGMRTGRTIVTQLLEERPTMATLTLDPQRVEFVQSEYGELVGKKISRVRPLTEAECEDLGWIYRHEFEACVIIFSDGTAFIPMADPEGNGSGYLMMCDTTEVK